MTDQKYALSIDITNFAIENEDEERLIIGTYLPILMCMSNIYQYGNEDSSSEDQFHPDVSPEVRRSFDELNKTMIALFNQEGHIKMFRRLHEFIEKNGKKVKLN